jgi:hypothetical protein
MFLEILKYYSGFILNLKVQHMLMFDLNVFVIF